MKCTRRIALLAASSLLVVAAPAPASTTSATPFSIHWSAPGDDFRIGRATVYDLRYSSAPLTAANFSLATKLTGLPAPAVAGSPESLVVTGLPDSVAFYLALKSADEVGNWSTISNVVTRPARVAGVDPSPLEVSFSSPWPNPARESVHWRFTLTQAAPLQVDVFDAMGRLVRTVASGERAAGRGDLSWDLRDDRGSPVGAGLYFARARIGSKAWTSRLVVVR